MKKIIFIFFLLAAPLYATTYRLDIAANGGSDSNNGLTTGTPWLTPNHSGLNCNSDIIIAAPGTAYSYTNFYETFGAVTCAAGNGVVWLKCATFDGCKITVPTGGGTYAGGMVIDQSYWGVQGWEVTTAANNWTCFNVYPSLGGATIHHIIFANDIANGCGGSGFSASPNGTTGVDYFAVVGSIAYNGAQGTNACASGINAYEPVASDSLPGTHIYFAGNFSFGNVNPSTCAGGTPTDGEGLFFDTFDGSQTSLPPYTQQGVMDNNISVFNGGRGMQALNNSSGSPHAHMYLRNNTVYGNETQTALASYLACSEITIWSALNTEVYGNLTQSTAATGCSGNTIYNYFVETGNGTDHVYANYGYSSLGNNTASDSSSGFSFGPSNTFANPAFASPANPGAPSCGSASSVPNCMATVIANFTPTNAAAKAYGYQAPSTTSVYDPLYPQWLCSVTNLPTGLVTPGCTPSGSSTASGTGSMK